MLRRQMTRDGFPTNADPSFGRLSAGSPPNSRAPAGRALDAKGPAGSALTMTPERRSVFCAMSGVLMPWRLRPRPSPARANRWVGWQGGKVGIASISMPT